MLFSFTSCQTNTNNPSSTTTQREEATEEEIKNDISFKDANYAASKKSDKYHKMNCRFVDKIKEENIVYYRNKSEAISDGKKPCSECKP